MVNSTIPAVPNISISEITQNASIEKLYESIHAFSWNDFLATIEPLALFVVGIAIYSIFVFKFYHFLARRNILKLHLKRYAGGIAGFLKTEFALFLHFIETIILVPIAIFFWFGVLATLLLLLGKTHSPESLLITAIAIVGAVRVTAYYKEDLSNDLAKMIPFALLGVFLVDMTFFDTGYAWEVFKQLPAFWKQMSYYILFVVAIEFIMRIGRKMVFALLGKKEKEEENRLTD